tara:strand:+ start:936 stop:1154 length:219 start_codon:yes stop_codon:yes gene_type:complete
MGLRKLNIMINEQDDPIAPLKQQYQELIKQLDGIKKQYQNALESKSWNDKIAAKTKEIETLNNALADLTAES